MAALMFDLHGRVAMVTGGNRGLGLGIARGLAAAGAGVVVVSRKAAQARAAAAQLEVGESQRSIGLAADVTNASDVERAVAQAIEHMGRIDVLVNNAGINIRQPIDDVDDDSWERIQATNVKAPFLCARAVMPHMRGNGYGRVINVGSMLGLCGLPERAAYAASKAAVMQLTRVMALEWAAYGINVNSLCPGPFATELNLPVLDDPEKNKFFVDRIPLGRWGNPDEIAGAAVFLASEASSFMTGSTLVVDGGWTAQ